MKYKRQLMSGMIAFTIIVSGSTVFAADMHVSTTTKTHLFKNQIKMKSDQNEAKVDLKDKNGKDIETNDDTTTISTRTHGTKNSLSDVKKTKIMRIHKAKENKNASSTKSL